MESEKAKRLSVESVTKHKYARAAWREKVRAVGRGELLRGIQAEVHTNSYNTQTYQEVDETA